MPLKTFKKPRDFKYIYREGQHFFSKGFVLQVANASHHGNCTFGFTASKKVGKAVARNLAKRRMRALAQKYLEKRQGPKKDYVMVARPYILTLRFSELESDLRKILKSLDEKYFNPPN